MKFRNPTNSELKPKGSSMKSDCFRAWLAGQMKKTKVITI
jgi:hypothetical protein